MQIDPFGARPPCLRPLMAATDKLQQAVRTPFPEPPSPEDESAVQRWIIAINNWQEQVAQAFGRQAGELYSNGVLSQFQDGPSDGGDMDSAVDVVGEPPDHIAIGPPTFRRAYFNVGRESLADRDPNRDLRPSVENWNHVQEVVAERYRCIVFRALSLVAWVRERIAAFDEAVMPSIEAVSRGSHHSVEVRVRQAGTTRTAKVTDRMHQFLEDLQRDGHAKLPRNRRKDLTDRIPELLPWLSPHASRSAASPSAAVYTVPAALQIRIRVDLQTE